MTKKLALAVMAAALLSTTALAQSNPPAGSMSAPAAKPMEPVAVQSTRGKWRASKLIGLNVYNTNNEKIGDINELITDSSGKIDIVVIGAGGFLGIGEHNVGIPFGQVKFVNEPVRTSATTTTAPRTTGTGTATSPRDHPRTTTTTTSNHQGLSRPCHGQHDQGSTQGAAGVQVRQRHLDDALHHDGSGTRRRTAPVNPPASTVACSGSRSRSRALITESALDLKEPAGIGRRVFLALAAANAC